MPVAHRESASRTWVHRRRETRPRRSGVHKAPRAGLWTVDYAHEALTTIMIATYISPTRRGEKPADGRRRAHDAQYSLGNRMVLFTNQSVMPSGGKSVNAMCFVYTGLSLPSWQVRTAESSAFTASFQT